MSALMQAATGKKWTHVVGLGVGLLLLFVHCDLVEAYRPLLNYTMADDSIAGRTVGEVGLDSELISPAAHSTSSNLTLSLIHI